MVAVRFDRKVTRLPTVLPRAHWPLEEVAASRVPESWVALVFATAIAARPVLLDIARAAVPSGRDSVGWPTLGVRRAVASHWPPADPSAKVAVLARLLDPRTESPPDLVVLDPGARARVELSLEDHPVLGRPTQAVVVEPDLSWGEWESLSPSESIQALASRGPRSLGPVDEQLVNPIGFDRDPQAGQATLEKTGKGDASLGITAGRSGPTVELGRGLSEVDLPTVRTWSGVRLAWSGGSGPQAYCRAVAQLAAAGVPLVSDRVPDWARHLLPDDLLSAITAPVALEDRLRREEHSVVVRRAAMRSFTAGAWRREVATAHGLQRGVTPRVSVLLATRRPGLLPFALRQLAAQRGADFEVVLATHGFEPDPEVLGSFRDACPAPVNELPVDQSLTFGQVLNRATAEATGDLVLKMDDDDWYGPDFVADLVLARGYSGADLVGCPPEFVFLEPLWTTTRQPWPTEVFRPYVAGGTMMVDRGVLRSLGGFRDTVRSVDANLLGAVSSAGGSIYRTHGLNYVLRRAASGHTWDPGLDYFLTTERSRVQWRGFAPSMLLHPDPADVPTRPATSIGRP